MPICYFDRDGIINQHIPYVGTWDRFKIHHEIIDVMKYFQSAGYQLIIITNQSGIGRKYFTLKDFFSLSMKMLDLFDSYNIDLEVRFCPHHPKDNCNCRKPKIGLLTKDKRGELDIFIGDQDSDMQCAQSANINHRWLINRTLFSKFATRRATNHYNFLNEFKGWHAEDLIFKK